jgi:CheY-like chemotaxis protein
MEGSEVVDQIRRTNPEIKILLASGYNLNSKIDDVLKKGCNGFIQKPFDLHKLSRELHRLQTEI